MDPCSFVGNGNVLTESPTKTKHGRNNLHHGHVHRLLRYPWHTTGTKRSIPRTFFYRPLTRARQRQRYVLTASWNQKQALHANKVVKAVVVGRLVEKADDCKIGGRERPTRRCITTYLFLCHEARPAIVLFENLAEPAVADHDPMIQQQQFRVNLRPGTVSFFLTRVTGSLLPSIQNLPPIYCGVLPNIVDFWTKPIKITPIAAQLVSGHLD